MFNKSNVVYVILCLSFVLLIAILFFANRKYKTNYLRGKQENKMIYSKLLAINYSMKYCYKSFDNKLPDVLLEDSDHSKTSLSKAINIDKKLVLVTTELNCEPCVNICLQHIKKFIEKVGKEKIIVLVSYDNFREFYNFIRISKLNCKVYNLPVGALKMPVDSLNLPYLFITDSTLKASLVFSPIKNYDTPTQDYFKTVISQFL